MSHHDLLTTSLLANSSANLVVDVLKDGGSIRTTALVAIPSSLAGLAILLVALLFYRFPDIAVGTRPRPDLKGPKGHPLLGNLLFTMKNKDPLGWQLKAQEKYGVGWSFTLPGVGRLIDVSRPDWIQHVQKDNYLGYVKGNEFHNMMKDVLGSGIFTVDGDKWKHQRKIAARIFTVNTFKNIITGAIRDDLVLLDKILAEKAATGEMFNIQDLYFRFTLSSFVKIAFSQDTGSLSHPDTPDEFGEAFAYAQKVLDMRFVKPFWSVTEKFNEIGRKMRASRKVIDDFSDSIVRKRLAEAKQGNVANAEHTDADGRRQDLLDLFIAHRNKDGSPLDPKSLRDAILNLLIAG